MRAIRPARTPDRVLWHRRGPRSRSGPSPDWSRRDTGNRSRIPGKLVEVRDEARAGGGDGKAMPRRERHGRKAQRRPRTPIEAGGEHRKERQRGHHVTDPDLHPAEAERQDHQGRRDEEREIVEPFLSPPREHQRQDQQPQEGQRLLESQRDQEVVAPAGPRDLAAEEVRPPPLGHAELRGHRLQVWERQERGGAPRHDSSRRDVGDLFEQLPLARDIPHAVESVTEVEHEKSKCETSGHPARAGVPPSGDPAQRSEPDDRRHEQPSAALREQCQAEHAAPGQRSTRSPLRAPEEVERQEAHAGHGQVGGDETGMSKQRRREAAQGERQQAGVGAVPVPCPGEDGKQQRHAKHEQGRGPAQEQQERVLVRGAAPVVQYEQGKAVDVVGERWVEARGVVLPASAE